MSVLDPRNVSADDSPDEEMKRLLLAAGQSIRDSDHLRTRFEPEVLRTKNKWTRPIVMAPVLLVATAVLFIVFTPDNSLNPSVVPPEHSNVSEEFTILMRDTRQLLSRRRTAEFPSGIASRCEARIESDRELLQRVWVRLQRGRQKNKSPQT